MCFSGFFGFYCYIFPPGFREKRQMVSSDRVFKSFPLIFEVAPVEQLPEVICLINGGLVSSKPARLSRRFFYLHDGAADLASDRIHRQADMQSRSKILKSSHPLLSTPILTQTGSWGRTGAGPRYFSHYST